MARVCFIGYLKNEAGAEYINVDAKTLDELISFLKSSKLKNILFNDNGELFEGIIFIKNSNIININKNVNIFTKATPSEILTSEDEVVISLPTAGG